MAGLLQSEPYRPLPVPFAAIISPDSLVFTAPSGETHSIAAGDAGFAAAKHLVRRIGMMRADGRADDDPGLLSCLAALVAVMAPASPAPLYHVGRVEVASGVVSYDGVPIRSALAGRIAWGLQEGFNMRPYIAFLDNLMQNPSKRVVDTLFGFVECSKMAITDDGHLLGYKRVRASFGDIETGRIDNTPGRIVALARNQVNDDPQRYCSAGLHVCAQHHLPPEHTAVTTIVIVKINPADVVAVPLAYDPSTARVCRYEVLSEYSETERGQRSLLPPDGTSHTRSALPPVTGDDALGDSTPGDASPGDDAIGDAWPGDAWPGDAWPGDAWPEDASPGDDAIGDDGPGDDGPAIALHDVGHIDPPPDATPAAGEPMLDATGLTAAADPRDSVYARGYDGGYSKGLLDAADPAVVFIIPAPHDSADLYASGFVDGWVAGMREGREGDTTEPTDWMAAVEPAAMANVEATSRDGDWLAPETVELETVLSEMVEHEVAQTPVIAMPEEIVVEPDHHARAMSDTDTLEASHAQPETHEAKPGSARQSVPLVEPDVALPPVTPIHALPARNVTITFDPASGRFRMR